jgi:hypothetical protein
MKIKHVLALAVVLTVLFLVPLEKETEISAYAASDSDGKASADIVNLQKTSEYFVILKNYPYGFVIMNWTNPGNGVLTANWTAIEGAGNIYIGYYNNDWVEQGPFTGSGFAVINSGSMENLAFRFRGEDTDFGVDAVAWLRVNLVVKKQVYGIIGLIV